MKKGKTDSFANQVTVGVSKLDLQPNSLLILKTPNRSEFQFQKTAKALREKYKFEGVVILMPETGSVEQFGVHQLEEIVKKLKGEKV